MAIIIGKKIKFLFAFSIILLVAIYGYHQSKNLFAGPGIVIISPKPFNTIYEDLITVRGTAKRAILLTLNDQQIFTDSNGYFEEQLLPPKGYNIITVKAKDSFGNEKKVIIEYLVKPKKS